MYQCCRCQMKEEEEVIVMERMMDIVDQRLVAIAHLGMK